MFFSASSFYVLDYDTVCVLYWCTKSFLYSHILLDVWVSLWCICAFVLLPFYVLYWRTVVAHLQYLLNLCFSALSCAVLDCVFNRHTVHVFIGLDCIGHCLCARLCCICAFCASSCAVLNCVFIGHCLCARVSGVFVLLCVVVCCRFLRALLLLFLSLLSSSSVGDAPAHKHHQPLHILVDVELFLEAPHFTLFLKIPRDPNWRILWHTQRARCGEQLLLKTTPAGSNLARQRADSSWSTARKYLSLTRS